AVSRIACCPHDEDFVAVATSHGLVVVWELHLESRGKPERVCVSTEHRDRAVTALCWDSTQHRLFVGDAVGRVSTIRASSSKQGKGASFVMFPVQTVTTVDSRVVQLSYLEGRLLVSSLTRCYLCDTDREKFWRIGNKERDGEYGACFFPVARNAGSPQALIYCARPGSRMWEVNFEGEVLSTHQFKQLLASPPLPLITHRSEPQYGTSPCSPQSISFPRLLFLSDQYVLTWTERGIYVFLPQSVQVLLWSEIKDVQDVAVYRNELFCLHGDGRLSHLSLMPVERCVERLLRRESWGLAATVCCLFQHAVSPSRARKSLPIDRLEHLKGQLDSSTQHELIGQLEEVISKLEPFDSASSSRRSSISSHESFNVLDCGIYRVISRRGSQSDEETSSLVSQTLSEDERLREFNSAQEEEPPAEHDPPPPPSERVEADRTDPLLQFHIPLSFRPTPPRVALQAVKDSVSSFMRKTTEKINTLQMPSDLWPKPDGKEGGQPCEAVVTVVTYLEEQEQELSNHRPPAEEDELRGLKEATARAVAQLQDPLVLLNTDSLLEVLRTWLPALERAWGEPEDSREPGDQIEEAGCPNHGGATDPLAAFLTSPQEHSGVSEDPGTDPGETRLEGEGSRECAPAPLVLMRVTPPCKLPLELHRDLTELATLCLELGCFHGDGAAPCRFLHGFFFLLDLERARRSCLMRYRDCPAVWGAYTAGLKELTRSSPANVVLEEGDLLKSLRYLRAQEPWDAAQLLAHLCRLYERHGELALRSFGQFYPTIIPGDVMALSRGSPAHFLAYLDNLVKWNPPEQRLSLVGSLLQPESLRQDWLELALSHDAPQPVDTISPDGNPRSRSHLFSWGYGQLLSLLLKLPGDLQCKEKMAETCRSHGFWTGYLYLCWQLERRTEAFSVIVSLDDMGLLEGPNGVMPETLEEWKYLLQTTQSKADEPASPCSPHGNGLANGGSDWSSHVSLENVTLLLARTVGPDRALAVLQECGLSVELSERSALVCEILRIAEKRQR
ncbi:HPS5 protein, partial [Polyodon spathula]|nr:HPS5 protein [Polyodon spathula]